MIHYLVVVGEPASVERVAPTLAGKLDRSTPLQTGVTQLAGPSQTWALAYSATDSRAAERGVYTDADSFAVVNGPGVSIASVDRVASQALQSVASDAAPDLERLLPGPFNFVGVTPDTGTVVTSDFSGVAPLYWGERDGVVVFSNRTTAVSSCLDGDEWDLRAMSWMFAHSAHIGTAMPAAGAQLLVPGSVITAGWGESKPDLSRSGRTVWADASDPSGAHGLSDDEWEEITAALTDNLRRSVDAHDRTTLSLSGGKDSRMCLALLAGAGYAQDLDAVTVGSQTSREFQLAARSADAVGMRHELQGEEAAGPALADALRSAGEAGLVEFSDQQIRAYLEQQAADGSSPPAMKGNDFAQRSWQRLRRAAHRYEAIVNPWTGSVLSTTPPEPTIKGFGGELYRRTSFGSFQVQPAGDLTGVLMGFDNLMDRADPLEILQPEMARYQADFLRSWATENSRTLRADLLPEKFYVDFHLGHWTGPLQQGQPHALTNDPLLSRRAAEIFFRLAPAARRAETLHHEVIRRTAPQLLDIPFTTGGWSPALSGGELTDESPKEWRARQPAPAELREKLLDGWQWRFLYEQSDEFQALWQRAGARTGLEEICEMDRLRQATSRQALTKPEARELLGVACIALTLLGETERAL